MDKPTARQMGWARQDSKSKPMESYEKRTSGVTLARTTRTHARTGQVSQNLSKPTGRAQEQSPFPPQPHVLSFPLQPKTHEKQHAPTTHSTAARFPPLHKPNRLLREQGLPCLRPSRLFSHERDARSSRETTSPGHSLPPQDSSARPPARGNDQHQPPPARQSRGPPPTCLGKNKQ